MPEPKPKIGEHIEWRLRHAEQRYQRALDELARLRQKRTVARTSAQRERACQESAEAEAAVVEAGKSLASIHAEGCGQTG